MKKALTSLLSLFLLYSIVIGQDCYKLIQSDEFEYTGSPDPSKWSFETWNPGQVNNELQHYAGNRIENSYVENGNLIIEARHDWHNGHEYSSARIHSNYKMTFKYGKIEFRAILPGGRGTWPALWLMPSDIFHYATTCTAQTGWINGCDAWPASGELDVMEYVGYQPGTIHGSAHTKNANFNIGNNFTEQIPISNETTEFHTYALEWKEDRIEWFVDDVSYGVLNKTSDNWADWPFDQEFYPILNIAVGGDWGGVQGVDNSIFPVQMVVDYVRFYEFDENAGQTTYNDIINAIPGQIEVENYDEGCSGGSYEDNDIANQGGDYRVNSVDIDISTSGTTYVGWTGVNEWLEYTVSVDETADYELTIRSASNTDGGAISLYLDDELIAENLQLPNTEGWDVWELTTLNNVPLIQGSHVLKIAITEEGANLDYLEFNKLITGLSGQNSLSISTYPNPAKNEIQLSAPVNSSYTLVNITGQSITAGNMDTTKELIQLESIEKGIYFLRVKNGEITETLKVIHE